MDVVSNKTGESTRPTRFDLSVRQAAAAKAWPVFRAWLISNGASVTEADADREDVLPELASALEYNGDGYEVAKHLDGRGWDADVDLVDAGQRLLDALEDALDAAVKSWVSVAKPAQRFAIGDTVQFTRSGLTVVGQVTRVVADRAKYVVYCASLGHVREGVGAHGTLGTLVNFEDAAPVST